jgi:hypothetical protein
VTTCPHGIRRREDCARCALRTLEDAEAKAPLPPARVQAYADRNGLPPDGVSAYLHPARVDALIAVLEGECDGLAVTSDTAEAILHYLDNNAPPSGVRVDAPKCEWPSCGCVDAYCKAWPKDENAAGVALPHKEQPK